MEIIITTTTFNFHILLFLFSVLPSFLQSVNAVVTPPAYFNLAVLVSVDENNLNYTSRFLPAILMAIDDINNKTDGVFDDLLPNTDLRAIVRLSDGEFYNGAYHARNTMSVDSQGIIAALGPPSLSTMKGAAPVFDQFGNIPVFSYGERTSLFGNSELYPNLLRIIPPDYYDGFVLASVIRHYFRWDKVSVFSASTDLGRGCDLLFRHYASLFGIKILSSHSLDASQEDYTSEVRRAKLLGARIIVLFVEGPVAVRLILQGSQVNFRNSIQILAGERLSSEFWKQNNMSVADYVGIAGVVGVKLHYYAPSSELKAHFINKWMNQQDTIENNNYPHGCDPSRDYYNTSYLFQYFPNGNLSIPPICTGVQFSKYQQDQDLLNDLNDVMYAYDSVLAIAHGLHELIYNQLINNPTPSQLYSHILENITFSGLTGEVSFSMELKSDDFNVGGRKTGVVYDIYNYFPNLTSTKIEDSFPIITTWHSEMGVPLCENLSYYIDENPCNRFYFNEGDYTIINDSPDPFYRDQLPLSLRVLVQVLSLLGILLSLVSILITFLYRNRRLIRMSQPVLTYFTIFGIILLLIRVFLGTKLLTNQICVALLWFEQLPFQFVFGAVLIRAWRVYNITASLKRKKITDLTCSLYLLLWMSPTLLMLFLITLDESIRMNYITVIHNQYQFILEPSCNYEHTAMLESLLFVYDAITLIVGLGWCWKIRNVRSTICNTPMLIQSLLTAIAVLIATLVLLTVFHLNPLYQQYALGLIMLFLAIRLLCLFESEILYQVLTGHELDQGLMLRQSEKSIVEIFFKRSKKILSESSGGGGGAADPDHQFLEKYTTYRSKEQLDREISRLQDDIKNRQMELAYVENMVFVLSESGNSSHYSPTTPGGGAPPAAAAATALSTAAPVAVVAVKAIDQ